jgi:hypothetical protein
LALFHAGRKGGAHPRLFKEVPMVIGFLYAGLAAAPAAAWGSALTVESPGKMRNRVVAERA